MLPLTLIVFFVPMWLLDYFTGLPFEWIGTVAHTVLQFVLSCFRISSLISSLKVNTILVITSLIFYYALPTNFLAFITNFFWYFFILYSIYMDEITNPQNTQENASNSNSNSTNSNASESGQSTPASPEVQEKRESELHVNISEQEQSDKQIPKLPQKRPLPSWTYLVTFLLFIWVDIYGRTRPTYWSYLAALTLGISLQNLLASELQYRFT